jgi:N-acetylneuraminic acid mutarotase
MRTLSFVTLVTLLLPYTLPAQTMNVHTSGGTTPYNLTDIDSITFTMDTTGSGSVWITKAPMPTARMSMVCGVVNDKIYVIGGFTGDLTGLSTVELFDPAANSWTTKASMPTPRLDAVAATVNGKIFVIGGKSDDYLSTVEVYDPDSNAWSSRVSMPTPRQYATASVIGGKIYVIGGLNNSSYWLPNVEIYDPIANSWSAGTNLPINMSQMSSASLGDTIYTLGGWLPGQIVTDTVLRYTSNAWTAGISLPSVNKHSGAVVSDGGIFCIGGTSDNNAITTLSSMLFYAPGQVGWTAKTNMKYHRCFLAAAVVNGKVYVIGGGQNNEPWVYYNYVEEYDPALDP